MMMKMMNLVGSSIPIKGIQLLELRNWVLGIEYKDLLIQVELGRALLGKR